MRKLKKIILLIFIINLILACFSTDTVRAEERVNEEIPKGEINSLEGIDLSSVEGILGEQTQEGPKNIIERLDITAHLNHDGSADMTEVWNVNMVTGKELTRIYTDFSSYKASNLSVEDTTTGRKYTFVNNWNELSSKDEKDDKCGIIDLESIINICWGIGDYGVHRYIVRYTISDFVKDYSTYQLVYLKILQDNMNPVPGKAKIMVYSDFDLTEDEVSISGYGFIGKTEFQNGYAVFETNGSLEQVGYMTIFLNFSNSPFDAKPALVLDLDKIRNNTSSEEEGDNENTKELEKKGNVGIIIGIISAFVVGVVVIVSIVLIKKCKIKNKKARRKK